MKLCSYFNFSPIKNIGPGYKKSLTKIATNLTRMLIAKNFLFILGNLPIFMTQVIEDVLSQASPIFILSTICSNLLSFPSHGVAIFIYYKYDRIYRELLNDQVKRLKSFILPK